MNDLVNEIYTVFYKSGELKDAGKLKDAVISVLVNRTMNFQNQRYKLITVCFIVLKMFVCPPNYLPI